MMNITYNHTAFLSATSLNKCSKFLRYLHVFLVLFVLATGLSLSAQTTYYVDASKADNTGDGLSWAAAKKDLQVALDAADAGDEIRVASGTYLPTEAPDDSTTDNRDRAFHLDEDVVLKGSYNTTTDAQDYNNPTILSGYFMDNDVITGSGSSLDITMNTDNAYHVLITANLTDAATIDGFTFSGGNANGTGNLTYSSRRFFKSTGGGMYNSSSSPTITNSTFSGNTATDNGGGMYNFSSSPTITNSSFSGNSATTYGGGMYNNSSSSPTITNSSFSGNNTTRSGGGMFNTNSSLPTITNSIFSGNTDTANGGGINNSFSSSTIINSSFSGNRASIGGGMLSISSTPPILYNTVFYANIATSSDPDINGAIDPSSSHNASDGTGGGISTSAGFVDLSTAADPFTNSADPDGADDILGTADDGLIPHATSPLINAGNNSRNTEALDITGRARIHGIIIDIGAYEDQNLNPCALFEGQSDVILYVNDTASGTADGSSWANAFTDLQSALDASACIQVTEIRVASGTYLPTEAPDGSTTDPRDRAFHLDTNVVLKGSYNTTTDAQEYNNPSILSGDIGTPDDASDNAYHVLITISLSSATTIDGFTISGGNADGSSSLTYSGQTFSRTSAGGLYNYASSPTITNSTFSGNLSNNGGSIYNVNSSPRITNSIFSGNTAAFYGGGINNSTSSRPTIINSVFIGNRATDRDGGGIYNSSSSSSSTIINSTFTNNSADNGGGMFNSSSSLPSLRNTVFYENTAASDGPDILGDIDIRTSSHNASDGTGGDIHRGLGFVDLSSTDDPFANRQDPDGVDGIFGTADDGLIPHATSPLINAGDNSRNSETLDIAGRTRIQDTTIDIGAYEVQPALHSYELVIDTSTLYPNPATDVLNIEVDGAVEQVIIYSLSGETIMSQKLQGQKQLDISSLPSGVYILKAISGL